MPLDCWKLDCTDEKGLDCAKYLKNINILEDKYTRSKLDEQINETFPQWCQNVIYAIIKMAKIQGTTHKNKC